MNVLIDAYASLATFSGVLLLCVSICIGLALRNYWLRLLSQQANQLRQDYDRFSADSYYRPGQYASWTSLRQQSEPLLPR